MISVAAFILLKYPVLSAVDQYKVFLIIDGETVKVENNGQPGIIRHMVLEPPEKCKKNNEPGKTFSQKSNKHLASRVLNKSAEENDYGDDRYGRILMLKSHLKHR